MAHISPPDGTLSGPPGRSAPRRRGRPRVRRAAGLAIGLVLAVSLISCGDAPAPSRAEQEAAADLARCQGEWRRALSKWEVLAASGFPSDLAGRWTALAADGAYRAATADEQCAEQLQDARLTERAIERLSGSLRTYDLVWQFGSVNPEATAWASTAAPAAAKRAQRALGRLEQLAPAAAADMDAAWRAAVRADLRDPMAMRDLADQMAFVAGDSRPFQQGSAVLDRLRRLISRR